MRSDTCVYCSLFILLTAYHSQVSAKQLAGYGHPKQGLRHPPRPFVHHRTPSLVLASLDSLCRSFFIIQASNVCFRSFLLQKLHPLITLALLPSFVVLSAKQAVTLHIFL